MSDRLSKGDSTVAQLKADIDSGKTGDKVAAPDPGLSPLGTDDEAAGRPNSPERIELARAQERKIGLINSEAPSALQGKWLTPVVMIAVIAVTAVLIAAVWWVRQ